LTLVLCCTAAVRVVMLLFLLAEHQSVSWRRLHVPQTQLLSSGINSGTQWRCCVPQHRRCLRQRDVCML